MNGFGMNDRNVYRRIDIVNALAAIVYTAKAAGGVPDKATIGALCLVFGIDIAEVARRVTEMDAAL